MTVDPTNPADAPQRRVLAQHVFDVDAEPAKPEVVPPYTPAWGEGPEPPQDAEGSEDSNNQSVYPPAAPEQATPPEQEPETPQEQPAPPTPDQEAQAEPNAPASSAPQPASAPAPDEPAEAPPAAAPPEPPAQDETATAPQQPAAVSGQQQPAAEPQQQQQSAVEPSPQQPESPAPEQDAEDGPDDPAAGGSGHSKDIENLVESVAKDREEMHGFMENMKGLEGRIKALQNFAEVLSIRYNPFLEENEEEGLFDDTHIDPAKIAEKVQSTGAQRPPRPPREEHLEDDGTETIPGEGATPQSDGPPVLPATEDATKAPQSDQAGSPSTGDTESASPVTDEPKDNERDPSTQEGFVARPVQEEDDDALTIHRSHPGPRPARFALGEVAPERPEAAPEPQPTPPKAAQGLRDSTDSYKAIAWLDHLSSVGDAPAVFLFLDYYHRVGWLTSDAHAWLCDLASGVCDRDDDLQWSDCGLGPHQLFEIHRRSLRYIAYLFPGHGRLEDRDARFMEETATEILGE